MSVRRTLTGASAAGFLVALGAILPWNDAVLGSLILLSSLGVVASLVLAIVRHGQRAIRTVRRIRVLLADTDDAGEVSE